MCYTGHMHTVVKVGRVASGPNFDCGYVPAHSHYSGKGPSERTAALVFDFSVDGLDRNYAPGPNCDFGAVKPAHSCESGKGEGTWT